MTLRGRKKPWSRDVDVRASTVEEALVEIGINPLEVLVKLNGEFVPDIEGIRTGDSLELLEITSRG